MTRANGCCLLTVDEESDVYIIYCMIPRPSHLSDILTSYKV